MSEYPKKTKTKSGRNAIIYMESMGLLLGAIGDVDPDSWTSAEWYLTGEVKSPTGEHNDIEVLFPVGMKTRVQIEKEMERLKEERTRLHDQLETAREELSLSEKAYNDTDARWRVLNNHITHRAIRALFSKEDMPAALEARRWLDGQE